MKVAVIGSRGLTIDRLEELLPPETTEIVSGGARGIDTCARDYALRNKIKYTEFLPDYKKFGKSAPLRRNDLIVAYADLILAIWDGRSHGTRYVIDACQKQGKPIEIFLDKNSFNFNLK
ncbi:MAG: DNA-protecting protein DprA [Bacteroides sp.]|nr:DNA-protecting protein DprA [Eubacterium sp.]MCM1418740.1 DNA-protecting protein DprA [Roseburia sp.]MCM1462808.1 DNA-protecting protein DprA [Bacteroides sp.]